MAGNYIISVPLQRTKGLKISRNYFHLNFVSYAQLRPFVICAVLLAKICNSRPVPSQSDSVAARLAAKLRLLRTTSAWMILNCVAKGTSIPASGIASIGGPDGTRERSARRCATIAAILDFYECCSEHFQSGQIVEIDVGEWIKVPSTNFYEWYLTFNDSKNGINCSSQLVKSEIYCITRYSVG